MRKAQHRKTKVIFDFLGWFLESRRAEGSISDNIYALGLFPTGEYHKIPVGFIQFIDEDTTLSIVECRLLAGRKVRMHNFMENIRTDGAYRLVVVLEDNQGKCGLFDPTTCIRVLSEVA